VCKSGAGSHVHKPGKWRRSFGGRRGCTRCGAQKGRSKRRWNGLQHVTPGPAFLT
jgi:hypothetical protein